MSIKPFDKTITVNGENIFVGFPTREIKAQQVEDFIVKAAEKSGQRLDWHYIGGCPVIWCDGDMWKAKVWVEALCPLGLTLNWVGELEGGVPIDYHTEESR